MASEVSKSIALYSKWNILEPLAMDHLGNERVNLLLSMQGLDFFSNSKESFTSICNRVYFKTFNWSVALAGTRNGSMDPLR